LSWSSTTTTGEEIEEEEIQVLDIGPSISPSRKAGELGRGSGCRSFPKVYERKKTVRGGLCLYQVIEKFYL